MEVTKDNFSQAFEMLRDSINDADFIAIDGEFTGLSTNNHGKASYDTLEQHYLKVKQGSSKFMLVQYGISLFTWNRIKEVYEAMPFSFYIYPRPYKRFFNDVMFMCQSSSLDFLANNGFDFNKLFYKGISFMSPWEQERAEKRMNKDLEFHKKKTELCTPQKSSNSENSSTVFIPKDQREFIGDVCKQVEEFIRDEKHEKLDLPSCNPFQRKLIYETLEEKYPMGLYLESIHDIEKGKFIRVIRITSKMQHDKKNNERLNSELELLDEIVGFTKVMKVLSESKKPIVGHNMFLDLFYTITNFFTHPPTTLDDYKLTLNSLFSAIIDTKLMSNTQPLVNKVTGTGLKRLYESIKDGTLPDANVVYSPDIREFIDESEDKFHQAGFDAYCTGCVFISLSRCLLDIVKQPSKHVDFSCNVLNPFMNRVNILGIKDMKYMDITGPDNTPNRKGVFLVEYPRYWKEKDLQDLFSPVSSLSKPTIWLSDTSAYVTISDEEKYDEVVQTLVAGKHEKDLFCVMPYEHPNGNFTAAYKENETPIAAQGHQIGMKRKLTNSELEDGEISSDEEPLKKHDKIEVTFDQPAEW